jgi:hypothetical protein
MRAEHALKTCIRTMSVHTYTQSMLCKQAYKSMHAYTHTHTHTHTHQAYRYRRRRAERALEKASVSELQDSTDTNALKKKSKRETYTAIKTQTQADLTVKAGTKEARMHGASAREARMHGASAREARMHGASARDGASSQDGEECIAQQISLQVPVHGEKPVYMYMHTYTHTPVPGEKLCMPVTYHRYMDTYMHTYTDECM